MSNIRSLCVRVGVAGLMTAAFYSQLLEAQTTSWTAPASGYVHDALTRTIRPVAGFVGSAVLGPAVIDQIDWVSLAPNKKSALVQRSGSLQWIADLAQPAQAQTLEGLPLARQAFWASDSSRAVILTNSAKLIWLTNFISSSGAAPTEEIDWGLQDLAPAASRGAVAHWSVLAVDSSANRVLLSNSAVTGSQLWMASRTAPPAPLVFSGRPDAAVFAALTPTAYVADSSAHRIVRISGLDGTPVAALFLTSDIYIEEPAGLALSVDDTRLFVADRATTSIRAFDSSTGGLTAEITADLVPLSLTPLGSTLFMLNSSGLSAQPLQFLDTTPPAKVSFVPRGN